MGVPRIRLVDPYPDDVLDIMVPAHRTTGDLIRKGRSKIDRHRITSFIAGLEDASGKMWHSASPSTVGWKAQGILHCGQSGPESRSGCAAAGLGAPDATPTGSPAAGFAGPSLSRPFDFAAGTTTLPFPEGELFVGRRDSSARPLRPSPFPLSRPNARNASFTPLKKSRVALSIRSSP